MNLFRSLIENVSDFILVMDADEIIRYMSPSVRRLLQYEPEEVIGQEGFWVVHQDDRQKAKDAVGSLVHSRDSSCFMELRIQHKNGSWRVMEVYLTNLLDDPTVEGIVINARDVTDRKMMEAQLNEYRQHLESLVDRRTGQLTKTNEALHKEIVERKLIEKDLRRMYDELENRVEQRTSELKKANEQLEALYKVGQTITAPLLLDIVLDTIAHSTAKLLKSDTSAILLLDEATQTLSIKGSYGLSEKVVKGTRDQLGESIAGRVVQSGQSIVANDLPNDARFVNPSANAEGLLACASVPLVAANRIIGTLDVHSKSERYAFYETDINLLHMLASQAAISIQNAQLYKQAQQEIAERKQVQDALRESEQKYRQFAYIASHDLQEPLRKIQTFSDRLQTRYGDSLDSRGQEYLSRMRDAARRLQTLIQDLLTLSRVTTKAQPFIPVDLAAIVAQVVSDLEAQIERVGGHVVIGDLPTIEADPTQMRQLFQNLIGNGLKFSRPDVPPVVEVRSRQGRIPTDQFPEASYSPVCRMTVKDNGIGFEEKHAEQIFQPFQRLHGRNKYEGTGIGLATCRKIVERHGGTIIAKSRPDRGSTFVVILPLVKLQKLNP